MLQIRHAIFQSICNAQLHITTLWFNQINKLTKYYDLKNAKILDEAREN